MAEIQSLSRKIVFHVPLSSSSDPELSELTGMLMLAEVWQAKGIGLMYVSGPVMGGSTPIRCLQVTLICTPEAEPAVLSAISEVANMIGISQIPVELADTKIVFCR